MRKEVWKGLCSYHLGSELFGVNPLHVRKISGFQDRPWLASIVNPQVSVRSLPTKYVVTWQQITVTVCTVYVSPAAQHAVSGWGVQSMANAPRATFA